MSKKHKWRLGEGTMRYAIVRNQKPKKRSMNYNIAQIAV